MRLTFTALLIAAAIFLFVAIALWQVRYYQEAIISGMLGYCCIVLAGCETGEERD